MEKGDGMGGEDETGGKRTCKGGNSKHTQTYTHLSRVVHSSWWDGVPFPPLHLHVITLTTNRSQLADTHI